MKLPFKPHLLVLVCSPGLFAASGVMFVKGRATEPAAPAPVAQQPAAPAPAAAQPAPVVAPAYTAAQIDQWVAPIALYPDALLSQILMASTYPANVIQAAQWSKDNPKLEGDAAIQAAARFYQGYTRLAPGLSALNRCRDRTDTPCRPGLSQSSLRPSDHS